MRSTPLASTLPVIAALLVGFGLLQMGNTLQGTLLAVRGGMEGFSPTVIGLIGGAFFAGMMAGSLAAGRMIRRVGKTRSFAALASLASMVPLIHLLWIDPVAWVAARALTGFCFAGLFMVVESWLNGAAANEVRGQILSLYGMTGLVAGVVGQLLLPVADPAGFVPFAVVSIILTIAVLPVTLSQAQAPATSGEPVRIDLLRLHAQAPFGVVAAFLCGVSVGAFFSLGPVLAGAIGFGQRGIALFMAAGATGAAAMTWPLGALSDRIDRRMLVVATALVAAAVLGAMALLTPAEAPSWLYLALVFVFGGLVVPTYSVVLAHVNDSVAPSEFVAASGGMLIVQGAGAALGPLAIGAAMTAGGPRSLLWLTVLAQALIALCGAWQMARRAAPARKEDFQVHPPTPVGTELVTVSRETVAG
ncbi:MFS transporter [Roseomonas sp. NAR14]|uniref:MFS transporter n=1 Tax=Roseomonas acroporae TaxID=2937791 RepID=A0A9X1YBT3_9PROT|nr:MFS transporter [Roseomonas acroporae]MCK8786835.1 MFS transporter [Roseomonas acroporae]